MLPGKKKKKKLTSNDNFKRPKNPKTYSSLYTFNRFISQFLDKIDTGRNKGFRKSHALINKYLSRKYSQSTHNITLRLKCPSIRTYLSDAPHVKYINSLEEHLNGDYFLYYQNKPDSYIHLINFDFDSVDDPDDNLTDDIYSTICSQRMYFNNSYYDMGSSSKSLNQFILIDSEPLFDKYLFGDSNLSFPRYVSHVLNHISRLLKFAYNNPSPFQLPKNLKFDGIKGTVAHYDYSNFNSKIYYNKIINSGLFAKLPRPTTPEQFDSFYHTPIVDIFNIIYFALYLFHISALSSPVDSKTLKSYNFLAEVTDDTALLSDECSFSRKNVAESNQSSYISSSYLPIISMSTVFSRINVIGSKSSDATERSRNICQQYFRDYFKEKNTEPSFEEFRKYYRNHPNSTGEETEKAVNRLERVYEYVKAGFTKELMRKSLYVVGEFIEKLKHDVSQEQIDQIRKNMTKYEYRITYQDIDTGLGYFFVNSMKKKENKIWSDKELTVPTYDMVPWFRKLKEQGQIKRSCNNSKARAIRIILEEIGYMECLDEWYSTETHTSMRWGFTKKFPKYEQFINYVGEDTVGRIREKGKKHKEQNKDKKDVA